MVLTRISLVIPLGMINVMQGTAQRQALAAVGGSVDAPSKRKKPKAKNMTVAFAPAVVFVVVGIKPDGAHVPYLWLMPAYSLHHFNKHLAIFYGLLIIK